MQGLYKEVMGIYFSKVDTLLRIKREVDFGPRLTRAPGLYCVPHHAPHRGCSYII